MNEKWMEADNPLPQKKRIMVLDSLRGFALLGIFLINITAIAAAGGPPSLDSKPNFIDEMVNQFLLLFVESKFFTLFSFLFGVGFSIQLLRANDQGINIVPRFSRRLAALFLFGVLHIALFWEGDILVIYAAVGFALLLFKKCSEKTLLIWIAGLLILPILIVIGSAAGIEVLRHTSEYGGQIKEADQELLRAFRMLEGGNEKPLSYTASITERINAYIEVLPLLISRFPTVLAMFLLGLYAGKKRIFEKLEENLPLLKGMSRRGIAIGLLLNLAVVILFNTLKPVTAIVVLLLNQTLTGPILSISYAAIFILLSRKKNWDFLFRWLSYPGRMALTNYILQSVLCSFIFNDYGFGLKGQVSLSGTILMAFGIYIVLMIGSRFWLKTFKFGPLEWVWRCITYKKIQSIR
ncbi:DUF418 domain-containing protein [Bacillus sp. SJS]|uniref:DUF418 domain-containing protein n=1 Tax=Bacillus sp. SJS TaxID=1423321 RepID=UPI0004DD68D9|nr:DUF418 domain-containing protein [Bacillus sp. SJS]KZZ84700.1 hypothetical protein AS29_009195 [Bacillus sp. SJS]